MLKKVMYHFAMCEATYLPIYASVGKFTHLRMQLSKKKKCYYVCCPLVIDCLMVYQNRKGLCKLISNNVQVSSLYVQL